MKRPILLIIISHVAVVVLAKGHIDFGYNGAHGPSHWAEDYDTCFGKHQSPINIEEHDVRDVNLPPLFFSGLDTTSKLHLRNNGHTALLHSSNDSEKAYLLGGPLNGSYVFEQLHFHWGENDREGSEDLINNHSFAMELHAVFYKKDYGSMNGALLHNDGLAVLAFFFEESPLKVTTNSSSRSSDTLTDERDNPMFYTIVEALPKIEKVGAEIQLPDTMKLGDLLDPTGPPDNRMQNYFTYIGSLTTPPCSEVVTWIDFKDPLYLSHSQIAAFRDIRSSEGQKLTHNFRPVQPLMDRSVWHNSPNHERASQIQEQLPSSSTTFNVDSILVISLIILLLVAPR